MKRILFATLCLMQLFARAQTPQSFNYQAVARDAGGNTLPSGTLVDIRFTLHHLTASGTVVYKEQHLSKAVNQFGLFSVAVGSGDSTIGPGPINAVDWSSPKFLEVEYKLHSASTYDNMGTTQLLSVPYALVSQTAIESEQWKSSGNDIYNANSGKVGIGVANPFNARFEIQDTMTMGAVKIDDKTPNQGSVGSYTDALTVYAQITNPFIPDLQYIHYYGLNVGSNCRGVNINSTWDGLTIQAENGRGLYSAVNDGTAAELYADQGYGLLVTKGNVGIGLATSSATLAVSGAMPQILLSSQPSSINNPVFVMENLRDTSNAYFTLSLQPNVFFSPGLSVLPGANTTRFYNVAGFEFQTNKGLAMSSISNFSGPDFIYDPDYGVGIGTSSMHPLEMLEVNGAVKIGNTTQTHAGTIRYTGTDFEGYVGGIWKSMTAQGGGGTQTLSLAGNNLTISGGNSVNLSGINTDNQLLTLSQTNGLLGIANGNTVQLPWSIDSNNTAVVLLPAYEVGIGSANPAQKLEVNGAIKIGTTALPQAGVIRYTGTDFEGYDNGIWKSFTSAGTVTLAGDVTGSSAATVVGKLQGRAVANTAPANGQVLGWNTSNNRWEPTTVSGGGGGGTLNDAYNYGGAGAGRTISAISGAVKVSGNDGFLVDGNYGLGTIPATGAGTRMMFFPKKSAFVVGTVAGNEWDEANLGEYAVAMGMGPTASGYGATAIGSGTASGQTSVVLGYNNNASGTNSIAIGTNGANSGDGAFTIGNYATANAMNAFAIGNYSSATNESAFSIGLTNQASGYRSLAMGNASGASNDYAVAIGHVSSASALEARALGYSAYASGDYSTAIGSNVHAYSAYETVLGAYNTVYTPSSTTAWSTTDRLFVLGNGQQGGPSDAMVVLKNGYTGLGVSNPSFQLQLANNSAAKPGTNTWTVASDARLKKDVVLFTDGWQVLKNIEPVKFHYNEKSGYDTKPEYVGVLAQQLQKAAPYMVGNFTQNGTEYLSVDNGAMTYVLINTVKEQQQLIEQLSQRLEQIEAEFKKR
ncbi:MAG: tail fiber domain-containing protein [Chitinophagales bacterium]